MNGLADEWMDREKKEVNDRWVVSECNAKNDQIHYGIEISLPLLV